MIIEVPKLPPEGAAFRGEEPAALLDLHGPHLARAGGPVRYDLFAQVVSHELIVRGTVETELDVECRRCAEFYSTSVREPAFLQSYDLTGNPETVDVTQDLREAVLLQLPMYPVCRPECRGLCPQCGKNLNEGACACRPPPAEGRWGALDGLKLP